MNQAATASPDELRDIQHHSAELERDRADALEIIVRRHDDVGLAVSLEEPQGQLEQLAQRLQHRLDLDSVRQANRQQLRREGAQGPQEPHAEDDDGALYQDAARVRALPSTGFEDDAQRPDQQTLEGALQRGGCEEATRQPRSAQHGHRCPRAAPRGSPAGIGRSWHPLHGGTRRQAAGGRLGRPRSAARAEVSIPRLTHATRRSCCPHDQCRTRPSPQDRSGLQPAIADCASALRIWASAHSRSGPRSHSRWGVCTGRFGADTNLAGMSRRAMLRRAYLVTPSRILRDVG